MDLRIAVCDDDEREREKLKAMVTELAEYLALSVCCVSFSSGEEFLKEDIKKYHILLLDIEMQGKNGLETAREIRLTNRRLEIVFVTVMAKYCSEGYRYQAYRYLIKPVKYEQFQMELGSLFSGAAKKEQIYRLAMAEMEEDFPVYTDINYIECYSHEILYHTDKKQYKRTGTMKSVEKIYGGLGFCRIHQSYMVNMEKIEYVYKEKVILEDKTELFISRRRRRHLMECYAEYQADKVG